MISMCRFFPSVVYLATSKVAVAVLGNLAFALALLTYHGIVKVRARAFAQYSRQSLARSLHQIHACLDPPLVACFPHVLVGSMC